MDDYGELPIEDFTHVLLKNVLHIKWLLVGNLIMLLCIFSVTIQ